MYKLCVKELFRVKAYDTIEWLKLHYPSHANKINLVRESCSNYFLCNNRLIYFIGKCQVNGKRPLNIIEVYPISCRVEENNNVMYEMGKVLSEN
jgi:hypothetical protein